MPTAHGTASPERDGCVLRFRGSTSDVTLQAIKFVEDLVTELGGRSVGDWAVELQAYAPHVVGDRYKLDSEATGLVASGLWAVKTPDGQAALCVDALGGSVMTGTSALQAMVEGLRTYRESHFLTVRGKRYASMSGSVSCGVSLLHVRGDQQVVGGVFSFQGGSSAGGMQRAVEDALREFPGEVVKQRAPQDNLRGVGSGEAAPHIAALVAANAALLAAS